MRTRRGVRGRSPGALLLLALALVLVLTTPACRSRAAADEASRRAATLRDQAFAALDQEDLGAAREAFAALAVAAPEEAVGPAGEGVVALRENRGADALGRVDEALARAGAASGVGSAWGRDAAGGGARADLLLLRSAAALLAGDREAGEESLLAAAGALAGPAIDQPAWWASPRRLAELVERADELATPAADAVAWRALGELAGLASENLWVLLERGQRALGRGDRPAASMVYLRVRELVTSAPLLDPPAGTAEALAEVLAVLAAPGSGSGAAGGGSPVAGRASGAGLRPNVGGEPLPTDARGPSEPAGAARGETAASDGGANASAVDLGAAVLPARRLANLLRATGAFRAGVAELAVGVVGDLDPSLEHEPPQVGFGPPGPLTFTARRLTETPTVAVAVLGADRAAAPAMSVPKAAAAPGGEAELDVPPAAAELARANPRVLSLGSDGGLRWLTAAGERPAQGVATADSAFGEDLEPVSAAGVVEAGELVVADLDDDRRLDVLVLASAGSAPARRALATQPGREAFAGQPGSSQPASADLARAAGLREGGEGKTSAAVQPTAPVAASAPASGGVDGQALAGTRRTAGAAAGAAPGIVSEDLAGRSLRFLRGAADGSLVDATGAAGLGLLSAEAGAVVDVDLEGDLDLVLASASAPLPLLLRNPLDGPLAAVPFVLAGGSGDGPSAGPPAGQPAGQTAGAAGSTTGPAPAGEPAAAATGPAPTANARGLAAAPAPASSAGAPAATAAVRRLHASDLDGDGDLDLALVGERVVVWENLRQGRWRARAVAVEGAVGSGWQAVASGDLDGDGRFELVVAGATGVGVLGWPSGAEGSAAAPGVDPPSLDSESSSSAPALTLRPLAAGAGHWRALAIADLDLDGRLDLALGGPGGVLILQRMHGGSGAAGPGAESRSSGSAAAARAIGAPDAWRAVTVAGVAGEVRALTAADLDRDGDLDLVGAGDGGVFALDNAGPAQGGWLRVGLAALTAGNGKNNSFGRGAQVEVLVGGERQVREMQGDELVVGLGRFRRADVLRVVWPNGVVQARREVAGDRAVVEEQVLKGSCPFLYVWDGERHAFVTDLLWNAPLGLPFAEGVWAKPDASELVKVAGAVPRDGAWELRVTEELWEAAFFDHVELVVVDHPGDVEVASSLRVVPGEANPDLVRASRGLRPVSAAWDGGGRRVDGVVRRRDEVYADGYREGRFQGASVPWSFTLDLGVAPAAAIRLHLDGWIFPADASLNLAMAQRRDTPFLPPRLEVETAAGWVPLVAAMGFPAGKTKTMVVDTPPLPLGARRLRIVTSLWLGWDRVAWTLASETDAVLGGVGETGGIGGIGGVGGAGGSGPGVAPPTPGRSPGGLGGSGGVGVGSGPATAASLAPSAAASGVSASNEQTKPGDRRADLGQVVARLPPTEAILRFRGFSALDRVAPNAPHRYAYERVQTTSPWLPFRGAYTRFGDVRELLATADDRSVILAPGDEIALRFAVDGLPALPAGWQRTVFLYSVGYDKDADRNTFEAPQVEPLPFLAMSGYPWGPGERYPDTPELAAYRRDWLTRLVP